jgi:hypothetical protein
VLYPRNLTLLFIRLTFHHILLILFSFFFFFCFFPFLIYFNFILLFHSFLLSIIFYSFFGIFLIFFSSRDSVVGIATGYGLDDRGVGVRIPVGSRIFSSPRGPDWLSIRWVPVALSPGVKRPGHEADHSPPTSAEVKKIWIYKSTPPYSIMA